MVKQVPEGRLPAVRRRTWPSRLVSPNDTAAEVMAKVREYLAGGVAAVWIVYPDLETIQVDTPDGGGRRLTLAATP